MAWTGILAVAAALAAAVPWSFALAGSDGLFVLFALAPPLVMALLVGLREVGTQPARAGQPHRTDPSQA